jgi:predicted RNase H-like HicB family nuclease
MHNEFIAIFERDNEWHIAYCPEIPGANGQGRTREEARASLAEAIGLILEDRREDSLRGVPADAERDTVIIEWSGARCSRLLSRSRCLKDGKHRALRIGEDGHAAEVLDSHGRHVQLGTHVRRFRSRSVAV